MKKTINMFLSQKTSRQNVKPVNFKFIAGVGVLAVALGIIMFLYLNTLQDGQALEKNINTAESFISNPENIAIISEIEELQLKAQEYDIYSRSITFVNDALSSATQFDSSVYNEIISVKPPRVNFTSLSFDTNVVAIECTTTDNLPPADFAQDIDNLDIFQGVEYQGFLSSAEQGYVFRIECILADTSVAEAEEAMGGDVQ